MMENKFYCGDCLFVLNHDVPPGSVDLIYLDPPFFTGKVQKGKKRWQPEAMEISFEDQRDYWAEHMENMRQNAPVWLSYIATKPGHAEFAAYLYYMMERLQACHRVLKKTGSIYLHCDYRASHYLKLVMDEIFQPENFRNEIVWCYRRATSPNQRIFGRMHDLILFYTKSDEYTFNADEVRLPYAGSSLARAGYRKKFHKEGDLRGGQCVLSTKGKFPEDWWDIPLIRPNAAERTGWPTQKPEALLERIIRASSGEGDVVLDPFCGCGTTSIVASKLNRRFIGVDIHPDAFEVIKDRAHELFVRTRYISRDLEEVKQLGGKDFEDWVREFYGASKPHPDRGVDGITQDGTPMQIKTYKIKYDTISRFANDAKYHPQVPKPLSEIWAVSQKGFDRGARQRQFEIETNEGIKVRLISLKEMLAK